MLGFSLDKFSGKSVSPKKRFQYCLIPFLEPNSPKRFLYLRAIQVHSGGTFVDPTLQDNVLLLDDFAEYINHIGNVTYMHSVANSGLIPGGKRLRRERQCVFCTAVNPVDEHRFPESARYDLDKVRIAVYKNDWTVRQDTVNWCNLTLAHKRGLQFYQTRSHAIVLSNTLPSFCIDKAVYRKN